MPEPDEEQVKVAATKKWAAYNGAMVALFAGRDAFPLDSPQRDAAVGKIMALWVAEG